MDPLRRYHWLMLRPRNLLRPAVRYPADPRAVFILALSVFSGFTTILVEAGPQTLESLMPRWGVVVWGVCLGLGSLLALVGLARDTDWGIVTEQVGCVMVGVATIFYSILGLYVLGPQASSVISIVLGWGLACILRWYQLQLLIHDTVEERQTQRIQEHLQQVQDEDS